MEGLSLCHWYGKQAVIMGIRSTRSGTATGKWGGPNLLVICLHGPHTIYGIYTLMTMIEYRLLYRKSRDCLHSCQTKCTHVNVKFGNSDYRLQRPQTHFTTPTYLKPYWIRLRRRLKSSSVFIPVWTVFLYGQETSYATMNSRQI